MRYFVFAVFFAGFFAVFFAEQPHDAHMPLPSKH